jgi:SAM-dependent methyltransferase
VIARRDLPSDYVAWNKKWHAPYGRPLPAPAAIRFSGPGFRYRGPFAHQANSSTRYWEYPWAYSELRGLGPAQRIVEIGGGLSGLQFVLAKEGHEVTNVDPAADSADEWAFSSTDHSYLGKVFGAPVRLAPTTIDKAGLADGQMDVVLCLSVLEHLDGAAVSVLARGIRRVLRPNGTLVMTADLFLDVQPFTDPAENRYGRNVNLREFLAQAGLELVKGDRRELCGFDEFDHRAVLAHLSRYMISTGYPALAQCFLARRCQN